MGKRISEVFKGLLAVPPLQMQEAHRGQELWIIGGKFQCLLLNDDSMLSAQNEDRDARIVELF